MVCKGAREEPYGRVGWVLYHLGGRILNPKVAIRELGLRAMVELVFHRRVFRWWGARGAMAAFRSRRSGRALRALRPTAGTQDTLVTSVARPGMVLVYRRVVREFCGGW